MTVQITILGLGQVGASIGLALGKAKDQVTRVGSDREPEVSKQAQKMGAVDKVVFNLPSSVETADVVVLAVPLEEVYATLKAIAADLKPGVVVIDTSPAASQSTAWAKELFPAEDRYFLDRYANRGGGALAGQRAGAFGGARRYLPGQPDLHHQSGRHR